MAGRKPRKAKLGSNANKANANKASANKMIANKASANKMTAKQGERQQARLAPTRPVVVGQVA